MTNNYWRINETVTKPEHLAFEKVMMRRSGNVAPVDSFVHEYRPYDGPKPCGSGSSYIPRPDDCRMVDLRELRRLEEQVRR